MVFQGMFIKTNVQAHFQLAAFRAYQLKWLTEKINEYGKQNREIGFKGARKKVEAFTPDGLEYERYEHDEFEDFEDRR